MPIYTAFRGASCILKDPVRSQLLGTILFCATAAAGAELHIRFDALKRMLSEQAFTQDGRRYVRGSKQAHCNFAYLESPDIGGQDGRLRINARFTGRTALDVFGGCVGLGDAFDVTILATPLYKDGNLGLRDVQVAQSQGRTSLYIRRVCSAMKHSLETDFRYPVAAEAKRILEEPGTQPNYPRDLRRFTVTDIRVSGDSLVLGLDFELSVR